MSKELISLEVDGNKGTAEVRWFPDDKYNVAHYEAFISVPYQDSHWTHLFIHDRADLEGAKSKATDYLQSDLQRCTLC